MLGLAVIATAAAWRRHPRVELIVSTLVMTLCATAGETVPKWETACDLLTTLVAGGPGCGSSTGLASISLQIARADRNSMTSNPPVVLIAGDDAPDDRLVPSATLQDPDPGPLTGGVDATTQ